MKVSVILSHPNKTSFNHWSGSGGFNVWYSVVNEISTVNKIEIIVN